MQSSEKGMALERDTHGISIARQNVGFCNLSIIVYPGGVREFLAFKVWFGGSVVKTLSLILSFFAFSSMSLAQQPQASGPVPAGDPQAQIAQEQAAPPLLTLAVPHFEKNGTYFGGFFGMNLLSNKLSSSGGFAAKLPYVWDPIFGVSLGWRPRDWGWDYQLAYTERRASYSGLSPLNPSAITSKWHEFSFEVSGYLANNFRIFVGSSFELQSPSAITSPNAVLTRLESLKLSSGFKFSHLISSHFFFHSKLGLAVPVMLYETSQYTGAYHYGYGIFGALQFGYRLSSFIDFMLGAGVSYSARQFAYNGTRGLSDGREAQLNFSLPLELKFYF